MSAGCIIRSRRSFALEEGRESNSEFAVHSALRMASLFLSKHEAHIPRQVHRIEVALCRIVGKQMLCFHSAHLCNKTLFGWHCSTSLSRNLKFWDLNKFGVPRTQMLCLPQFQEWCTQSHKLQSCKSGVEKASTTAVHTALRYGGICAFYSKPEYGTVNWGCLHPLKDSPIPQWLFF